MQGRVAGTGVLTALLSLGAGCAMQVEPAVRVQEPVTVCVADYGYHLSLILPNEHGGAEEFAYGWWEWFALNQDRWYNAIPLLLFPGRGALGTRTLQEPPSAVSVARRTGAQAYELRVERAAAERLLHELRRQYESQRQTEIYNPVVDLRLVHHRDLYWFHHNCNSAVANWLEQLGVRVGGDRMSADVRVRVPPAATG